MKQKAFLLLVASSSNLQDHLRQLHDSFLLLAWERRYTLRPSVPWSNSSVRPGPKELLIWALKVMTKFDDKNHDRLWCWWKQHRASGWCRRHLGRWRLGDRTMGPVSEAHEGYVLFDLLFAYLGTVCPEQPHQLITTKALDVIVMDIEQALLVPHPSKGSCFCLAFSKAWNLPSLRFIGPPK